MRFLSAWLPVLLFEAVVVLLSSRPGGVIPLPIAHLDKVLHFGEYAALGLLLYRAFRLSGGDRRESVIGALVGLALLGLADEGLQSRVPGRDSSIQDWFADLAGGTIGVLAGTRWERFRPQDFRPGRRVDGAPTGP